MPSDLMSVGVFGSSSFTRISSDHSADTKGLTSFTANLKSQKDKHNRKILNRGAADQNEPGCNCQKSRKKDCPIPGQCATPFVVYRACVRRHDTLAVDTYT